MRRPLSDFSTDPLYNIKAVEQQTQIVAATLRAWERRYHLIAPQRTDSGYRLYSERDVALINWIREQMHSGLTISRAVAMLNTLRENDEPIWVEVANTIPPLPTQDSPMPPDNLINALFTALITLDHSQADHILSQAFAVFGVSDACLKIVIPTLAQIGDARQRGELLALYECFASSYLRGRLLALLQLFPAHEGIADIFVGCAPGEYHEIGALIFSVLARQRGYRTLYLGQSVPINDISLALAQELPDMVVFTANNPKSALALAGMEQVIAEATEGHTRFAYAGQAFENNHGLHEQIGGVYLGDNLQEAVHSLGKYFAIKY